MTGTGQKALQNVREWSGDPPGCPGLAGRPYWMSVSGRKALRDDREWSEGPPECPRVVGRP